MKKIVTYSLVILALLLSFNGNMSYNVVAESNTVDVPKEIDISKNETSFDIKLLKEIGNNQRVLITVTGDSYLTCDSNSKIKLDIKLSNKYLTNETTISTVTITHEELPFGNWECNLKLSFKLENDGDDNTTTSSTKKSTGSSNSSEKETNNKKQDVITKEEKIMYSYKTVTVWDEENYLLEKPNCDYEERIQYASSFAQFSDSSYSLAIPQDSYYKERTQYGYNERSKTPVSIPHTSYSQQLYNNVGACPADCISGTINNYGSGCECMINVATTTYTTSYNYGSWAENSSSWRYDSPYSSSDTVEPIERTVYLTPTGWSEPTDWSYTDNENTNESKSVSRTVYVVPASYSQESPYQDSKPTGEHLQITQHKFCRTITNGVAGEWQMCD